MGERLRGKRALVYGGGTGIGFACAGAMVREGAAVVVSSRRSAVLEGAVERLRAHLASDLAAFVTGQAIAIDGGYSAR
jgi:NAD(P)-dependent dehydrogenase (short-subunit alcohol dehydrogenase family)